MPKKNKTENSAPKQAQNTETEVVIQKEVTTPVTEGAVQAVVVWGPDKDWSQEEWRNLLNKGTIYKVTLNSCIIARLVYPQLGDLTRPPSMN